MHEYENQKEIDELQKAIDGITPDIKLRCFSVFGNRAVSAIIDIPQAGNKTTINKLISIGFKKVARYKKPLPHYAPLSTKDTFVIRLERGL